MLTYTGRRNLFGNLSVNAAATNITLGDQLMNIADRQIISSCDWDFLEKTQSMSTVGSQQFYNLPADFEKLINVTVTIGTTTYSPIECSSRAFWDIINQTSTTTSNTPQYYFIFNKQLGFYPTPASSTSNAITFIYKREVKDLAIADYTTGTITSVTSGASAVVGSGTTWRAQMVNSYLQIAETQAAITGDNFWYQISAVPSATTLTLTNTYNGATIAAGSLNYVIGQISIIPEDFQETSVFKAVEIYYTSVQPDELKATLYKKLYEESFQRMKDERGSKVTDPVIDVGVKRDITNPNLFITY